jgi:prefoldin alpha subunit
VFVKAQILDKTNFIISTGANVHVEKGDKDAKLFIEERKKTLEDNEKKLQQQANQISQELEAANQAAEELYAKLQK